VSPLADRVALVTGASRGIGLAIAEALREAGSRVVRIARSLHDGHDQHFTDFGCDITDEVTVRGTVERLIGEVGVPDILVNNAGTFLLKPFAEMSKQELEEQLAVNLVGPFIPFPGTPPTARANAACERSTRSCRKSWRGQGSVRR
jgi:NAD(P)-dependent dehydrogenase (short-subunit alcohol dehydrogenase family)